MIKRSVLLVILCALLASCMENGPLAPVGELRWRHTTDRGSYHVVKPGDTLYAIAFRYDVDYRTLARYNHLHYPYVLQKGRVIRRPPHVFVKPYKRYRPVYKPVVKRPQAILRKPVSVPYQSVQTSHVISTGWLWPVSGIVRTTFNANAGRKGIDIAVPKGSSVKAARAGVVAYAGEGLPGYGHLIIIKHDNQWLTAYGNNQRHRVVEGQKIKAGQIIAETGMTAGGFSGLHFEIRRSGQPVNPLSYLPAK